MYTQCPECLVVYKLGAATVVAARGRVRCASCAAEFDALATLSDELPPEPIHSLALQRSSGVPPLLNVPAVRPKTAQRELFVDDGEDEVEDTGAPATGPDAIVAALNRPRGSVEKPMPVTRDTNTIRAQRERGANMTRKHAARSARSGGSNVGWWLGAAVLMLALGAQFAWAYRAELLAYPEIQRAVTRACQELRCTIPAVAAPERIALLSRDIRPHPTVPNALVISATVSNNAPFAQPYPTVQITLADPNERRIAMRRFVPSEYLSDPGAGARGLAAGATASFALEVEDPGKNAVAFEFSFL